MPAVGSVFGLYSSLASLRTRSAPRAIDRIVPAASWNTCDARNIALVAILLSALLAGGFKVAAPEAAKLDENAAV